jgi:hypothetical protein
MNIFQCVFLYPMDEEINMDERIWRSFQIFDWSSGIPCSHALCVKQKEEARLSLAEALQYDSPTLWTLIFTMNWSIGPIASIDSSGSNYQSWKSRRSLWPFIVQHQLIQVAVLMLQWFPQDAPRIKILLFEEWNTILYEEFIQHLDSTTKQPIAPESHRWFHYDRFQHLTPLLQQSHIIIQQLCQQLYSLQYYDALEANAIRAFKCNLAHQNIV